jgi:glycosyltransferase involved in cell wall biosynthesis
VAAKRIREIDDISKTRVLHLGSPIGLYGAERWILALVKHLPGDIVDSIVGVIKDDPNLGEVPICRESESLGLKTAEFSSYGKLSYSAVRKIRDFIHAERIDILHTHGYKTDLIGLLAVRGTNCRTVATPHGWSTNAGVKLQIYEFLDRLGFYFADAVVPLSQDMYDGLSRWPGIHRKLLLILNGVDISEIDAAEVAGAVSQTTGESGFLVGYIGQLISRKRLDVLIRAFGKLNVPGKRMQIVGEGPQRAELEALAGDMCEFGQVEFLGYREDRLKLLKNFDVFVLPSSLEGIPRCLMEAMAARVPVVASEIPGCTDLVKSGESGILFPLNNENALCDAMENLANSPAKRTTLAENGRRFILMQYSAESMARKYAALYTSLSGQETSTVEIQDDVVS